MYKVSSSHFQFTGTENSDHNIQKTLSIIGSDNTCFHYVYFVNLILIRSSIRSLFFCYRYTRI